MTVHEPKSHDAIEKLEISQLYNHLRKDISKLDGEEVFGDGDGWGNGQATFGHLMGGYQVSYLLVTSNLLLIFCRLVTMAICPLKYIALTCSTLSSRRTQ